MINGKCKQIVTLTMEAIRSSETLVAVKKTIRSNNPEDHNFYLYSIDNVKSQMGYLNFRINTGTL
jgi:hypothetical protein